MNPNHVALSIPSEMLPQMVNVLEQWVDRERPLFAEEPPDEEREYILAPMNAEYVKADMYKPDYMSWKERLDEPYEPWAERRKKKKLPVPDRRHGVC